MSYRRRWRLGGMGRRGGRGDGECRVFLVLGMGGGWDGGWMVVVGGGWREGRGWEGVRDEGRWVGDEGGLGKGWGLTILDAIGSAHERRRK